MTITPSGLSSIPAHAQQPGPPQAQRYTPNCPGCIQLNDEESTPIIKQQRAMIAIRDQWEQQVKEINQKLQEQQKIVNDKVKSLRDSKKVPENYVFDYENLQFVPPAQQKPAEKEKK